MEALRDVLAETPAVRDLMAAAAARRPAHSLLLEVRDPSLGRAIVAAFLAALYCDAAAGGGAPCGACRDCVSLRDGAHAGVVHVEPDGNTLRVDQIRQDVLSRIGERVPGGRHQVFVLHGAQALGEESGNALLKAVEEPPPATVFILLTEDRAAVLGTIRSRSREVVIPTPDLAAVLAKLGADPAYGAAALLTAGFTPGVVERLSAPADPPPDAGDLAALAGRLFDELDDGEVLRDPRVPAHRPAAAAALFDAAADMLARPAAWATHARRAHGFADVTAAKSRARAKAIRKRLTDEAGEGYEHPTLRREAAFARTASTRAAEDMLRALTAALAGALRLKSDAEPFGLAGRAPALHELARRPTADLLGRARRVRRARGPLRRNQNLRLLFEELFLDLEGARLG